MEITFTICHMHVGKRNVKIDISSGEKSMAGLKSAKRSLSSSVLEFKLYELRKEVSSIQGEIFPHSVLSTQQISMISSQKPNSMEQASSLVQLVFSTNPSVSLFQ